MINRSRIAYKDYLGEETVTETKVLVEGTLSEQGTLTLKDPSFTGFVVGENYDITIDGVTEAMTAYDFSGEAVVLGNITDPSSPPSDGWAVGIIDGTAMCSTFGSYIGKPISISQTKTITEKHYDIKKLPDELLPSTVAKKTDLTAVKKLATNAQATAETAQTTADAAQIAADEAKTSADEAQTTADRKLDKDNPRGTGCFSLNTEYSTAVKDGSVAFGSKSRATGTFSFAHGGEIIQLGGNEATGAYSHAEGRATNAIGVSAHSEGERTYAYGISSHAEGRGTTVHGNFCHVEGQFNKLDQSGQYAHVVGNGTENHLSNAYTLDWDGNAWFAGDVYVGSTSGTNRDNGSKKLATEEFVKDQNSNFDNTPCGYSIIGESEKDWSWSGAVSDTKNGVYYQDISSKSFSDNTILTVNGNNYLARSTSNLWVDVDNVPQNPQRFSGYYIGNLRLARTFLGGSETVLYNYYSSEDFCIIRLKNYNKTYVIFENQQENVLISAHFNTKIKLLDPSLSWKEDRDDGMVFVSDLNKWDSSYSDEGIPYAWAVKKYVDSRITKDSIIISSKTKKFKITVDDSGTLTTTEVI